jgi:inner membrane protein
MEAFSKIGEEFTMQIEWWYWIIAGFSLIGLQLIIPSFTIIWFGLGALLVGIVTTVWTAFPAFGQILFWSAISISFTAMWFKYLKSNNNRTHAGSHPWMMGNG